MTESEKMSEEELGIRKKVLDEDDIAVMKTCISTKPGKYMCSKEGRDKINLIATIEAQRGEIEGLKICFLCGGVKRYKGDAPLPSPLTISSEGLKENHCGYKGAPSPRFEFECPLCTSKAEDSLSRLLEAVEKIFDRSIPYRFLQRDMNNLKQVAEQVKGGK